MVIKLISFGGIVIDSNMWAAGTHQDARKFVLLVSARSCIIWSTCSPDILPRHGDAFGSPDLRTSTVTWNEYLVVIFVSLSPVVCLLFFLLVFWVLLFVVCACSPSSKRPRRLSENSPTWCKKPSLGCWLMAGWLSHRSELAALDVLSLAVLQWQFEIGNLTKCYQMNLTLRRRCYTLGLGYIMETKACALIQIAVFARNNCTCSLGRIPPLRKILQIWWFVG